MAAACQCRVPISEFGTSFTTNRDMEAWLDVNGIRDLAPDYLGRPSITLADAYKLRAKAVKAEREYEAQVARRAAIHNANRERQEAWPAIYGAALREHSNPAAALRAARKVLADTEKHLPRDIRAALDPLPLWGEMTF